jgi:hypothetical protein
MATANLAISTVSLLYLVVVLDVPGRSVVGHHLLDLNRIYGLT